MGFKTNNPLDRMVALKQTVDDGDDDQDQTSDGDTSGETSKAPTLTDEQWATLLDAMGMEEDSTADELVAAVTQLVEVVSEFEEQHDGDGKVSASAADDDDMIMLERDRHSELVELAKLGEQSKVEKFQRKAEGRVTTWIDQGKIGAASKDKWVKRYLNDPEGTEAQLSKVPEGRIPLKEIGHSASSSDMDYDQDNQPTGWVV